jgi:hypothetical protein
MILLGNATEFMSEPHGSEVFMHPKAKTISAHVQYFKDQRNYLVKIAFRVFFGSCQIHENISNNEFHPE